MRYQSVFRKPASRHRRQLTAYRLSPTRLAIRAEPRLARADPKLSTGEFRSKDCFIRFPSAVCKATWKERSSHEQRKYDEGRRFAAGDQDYRQLCGQSYAGAGPAVGPDHLGAADAS